MSRPVLTCVDGRWALTDCDAGYHRELSLAEFKQLTADWLEADQWRERLLAGELAHSTYRAVGEVHKRLNGTHGRD